MHLVDFDFFVTKQTRLSLSVNTNICLDDIRVCTIACIHLKKIHRRTHTHTHTHTHTRHESKIVDLQCLVHARRGSLVHVCAFMRVACASNPGC